MTKSLKILKTIYGLGILIIISSCSGSVNKTNLARKKADYIIANLDKANIDEKFPTKYFPKDQLTPILLGIKEKCDWQNKDGKFVDFFTQANIGGRDQTSFIYEYYLKCDSLRFILSFDVEDEPELMSFRIEQLQDANPMILFPEKHLKNR